MRSKKKFRFHLPAHYARFSFSLAALTTRAERIEQENEEKSDDNEEKNKEIMNFYQQHDSVVCSLSTRAVIKFQVDQRFI